MLRAYLALNRRSPTLVQAMTAGCIGGSGDVLMQKLEHQTEGKSLDWARVGQMVLYRGCIFGPLYSVWVRLIERTVSMSGWRGAATKVLLDQLVWTPPSQCMFYIYMCTAEGLGLKAGLERARRMIWPTLQVSICR